VNKESSIYIAGHNGMVGSAIVRLLISKGYNNLILKNRKNLDLTKELDTKLFFKKNLPDYVINAAGLIGGINANIKSPVEFCSVNFLISNNLLKFSSEYNVKKIVMIGSSCMYPHAAKPPFQERDILSNKPEPTNEGFALSKIMSLKLSQYYSNQYGLKTLNLIASNLYGTNDHYDLENSHVLSALIKKFVDADRMGLKEVKLWGSGKPIREFMHVDDFAEALFFLIKNWGSNDFINVGSGEEISIKNLAELIINKTGYKGSLLWDNTKKDGMIRKCLDISSLKNLNYKHKIPISEGIVKTINEYKKQIEL